MMRRRIRMLHGLFVRRPVTLILAGLALFHLVAAGLVMAKESMSFGQAAGMIMPAFVGELGEVECTSVITRVSILAALTASVAFLAVITASVTSSFVEFCKNGGSVVKRVSGSGHLLVCGWNYQGSRIVGELLKTKAGEARGVAIIANLERRPVEDGRVEFVRGEPTQADALIRAGVKKAGTVIVLSDCTRPANEADAEALMIVLAVESIHPEVHSTVLIMNSDNREHFVRAGADEIICLDQVGGDLIVASATNHGVSKIVSELLTFNSGSEFYRYDSTLPDELVGMEFAQAVDQMATRRRILIGFETDDSDDLDEALRGDVLHRASVGGRASGRVLVVNPQAKYRLRQGDALFIIAESKPETL